MPVVLPNPAVSVVFLTFEAMSRPSFGPAENALPLCDRQLDAHIRHAGRLEPLGVGRDLAGEHIANRGCTR